jgi:hypothetical protein
VFKLEILGGGWSEKRRRNVLRENKVRKRDKR